MEVATKADEVYKLQPLPDDSSRKLFYRRIYGDEGKYVHNQPDEISDDILKKCGGIPLAIITMASFLVGKPAELWSELYKSIGFGCKDNTNEADNIVTRILSLSYYDLPSHLRTCLLYLSAFPEDSVIPKDALVWKWIAEGFVHEKQGIRLFEIGEAYFNDLINRSMIEAVTEFDYDDSIIIGCCVHDMVLDFIRSMSREEFFFTVLDNGQGTQQQSNARRLAYQYMPIVHPGPAANHLAKVRSFIAHSCAIETCLSLSSFELLRVLAIEDCSPRGDCGMRIEHLRHLLHLRYLSLRNTRIDKISEEIGALRYLQTLDLRGSVILQLPSSISLPTQLVCLRISFKRQVAKVASVVERLTSLEELSIIFENPVVLQPRSWLAKALGSLRELRVLETIIFHGDDESEERYLLRHLPHLQKLQHLVIKYLCDRQHRPSWEEAGFVLPWHLRHLTVYGTKFHKLPSCINPSCLPNLSYLDLMLDDMDEQDLKILGRLPELRYLELRLKSTATISNVSDSEAGYFLKLRCCRLSNSMVLFLDNKEDKCISFHLWNGEDHISMPFDSYYYDPDDETPRPLEPSKLQHGTPFMPRLQILYFTVRKQALRDHRYCTALGLEYLSSLQEINFMFSVSGRLNVEEKIYQALRRAADAHPNRPPLHNRHWC